MFFSTAIAFFSLCAAEPATATAAKRVVIRGEPMSPWSYALLGLLFIVAIFGGGVLHLLRLGASSVTQKSKPLALVETDPYPIDHTVDDL